MAVDDKIKFVLDKVLSKTLSDEMHWEYGEEYLLGSGLFRLDARHISDGIDEPYSEHVSIRLQHTKENFSLSSDHTDDEVRFGNQPLVTLYNHARQQADAGILKKQYEMIDRLLTKL